PRILEVMEDGQALPRTFEEWEGKALKALEKVKAAGLVAVKAHIEPEAFLAWCKAHSYRPNSEARQAFGGYVAASHAKDLGLR
ncbi:MAG TPA: hypothetical protein VJ623_11840, partial [Holophagaceae bacterium]|nr:hypothetical protein [Holophagaceae bacterium]